MKVKFSLVTGIVLLIAIGILCSSSIPLDTKDAPALQILKEMLAKSKQINTMSYTMKKQERIDGKMPAVQESKVKLSKNPLKVYLRQLAPKDGLEVLYVSGKNNNNALINTNGFPWVNVNLDPLGGTMRENQHHTLLESGYSHLMSILEHLTIKYSKDVESMVINNGNVTYNGRTCISITLNNPHFQYSNYTVKKGETLITIAERSKLSEYMILEINKSTVDSYTDVSEGQIIKVPSDYSPKMELYIDKQNMLPLLMKVYDEKSLYESYEYSNVVINPVFKSNEFDKSFPEYKF